MMFGGGAKPRGGRMSSELASDAVVPGTLQKSEQDSVAPVLQLLEATEILD